MTLWPGARLHPFLDLAQNSWEMPKLPSHLAGAKLPCQTGNPVFSMNWKKTPPKTTWKTSSGWKNVNKCTYVYIYWCHLMSKFMYHSTCTGNTYVNPLCIIYHKVPNDCRSSSIIMILSNHTHKGPKAPESPPFYQGTITRDTTGGMWSRRLCRCDFHGW